jgi:hypothetical protein
MTLYDIALRKLRELRGDFNGGFRASIPALKEAQVDLNGTQTDRFTVDHSPHRELTPNERAIWDACS